MVTRAQWHILKIVDYQNSTNLQITLNQVVGTVEFSIVNYSGYLQTVTFEANYVSNFNILIQQLNHILETTHQSTVIVLLY